MGVGAVGSDRSYGEAKAPATHTSKSPSWYLGVGVRKRKPIRERTESQARGAPSLQPSRFASCLSEAGAAAPGPQAGALSLGEGLRPTPTGGVPDNHLGWTEHRGEKW